MGNLSLIKKYLSALSLSLSLSLGLSLSAFNKLNNSIKGFSLTELLITISVIGILSAVAVPSYQSYVEQVKQKTLWNHLNVVKSAYHTCRLLRSAVHCSDSNGANLDFELDSDWELNITRTLAAHPNPPSAICFGIKYKKDAKIKNCYAEGTAGFVFTKNVKRYCTTIGECVAATP